MFRYLFHPSASSILSFHLKVPFFLNYYNILLCRFCCIFVYYSSRLCLGFIASAIPYLPFITHNCPLHLPSTILSFYLKVIFIISIIFIIIIFFYVDFIVCSLIIRLVYVWPSVSLFVASIHFHIPTSFAPPVSLRRSAYHPSFNHLPSSIPLRRAPSPVLLWPPAFTRIRGGIFFRFASLKYR